MRKIYVKKILMMAAFLTGISSISTAQHYEQFGTPMGVGSGDYGYYNNYGDSVSFIFTGLPTGAFANCYVSVFFYGDDGDPGEDVDVYINNNYLGNRAENLNGDCAPEDSVAMPVSYTALNTYISNDTIIVTCWPSSNVDFFCSQTTLRCKLIYDYCIFGMPVQFANFTVADSSVCSYQAPVALTGTPAGGTYTGTGVSGNTFVPTGLNPGMYSVTYTATDSIGCSTTASHVINILSEPLINDYFICEGDSATFIPNSGYQYVWYSQSNYNGVIDTTIGPLTYGPINQPTTLYVADVIAPILYRVDSLNIYNYAITDIDALAGDDRGSIAVTDSFIYMVGDNNTVRFDLDFVTSAIFPVTDGIFSDLGTYNLYTLCSDITGTYFANGDGVIAAIQLLNNDLTPNGSPIALSAPIPVGGGSIFLSGAGVAGLYNGSDGHFYVITTSNGVVSDLGVVTSTPNYYTSENWASYGVLEFDGTSYSALYRDGNYIPSQIVRHTMPGGTPVIHTSFVDGLSDLAAFTFSRSNQRWYFHYEGSSTTFGGSSETLGYADGQDTIVFLTGSVGCYASFDVTMDMIDLGNDTTVCESQTPVVIEAGNGYLSYTWNGVNNNWNIYPVTASGQYVVDAVNGLGCHVIDTVVVTVNPCLGVEELTGIQASVYPNPSNGNFNVQLIPSEGGQAEIEVIDMHGRKMYSRIVEVVPSVNTLPISLTGISDGVYLVNVRFNDHSSNFKMIIKQ